MDMAPGMDLCPAYPIAIALHPTMKFTYFREQLQTTPAGSLLQKKLSSGGGRSRTTALPPRSIGEGYEYQLEGAAEDRSRAGEEIHSPRDQSATRWHHHSRPARLYQHDPTTLRMGDANPASTPLRHRIRLDAVSDLANSKTNSELYMSI